MAVGVQLSHQELKSSIVDCEANEDRDKEYNHLVPTDFYYRNVENITAEQILLQFFAGNEEWMLEKGLLVNGELKIYTTKNYILVDDLWRILSLMLCRNIKL